MLHFSKRTKKDTGWLKVINPFKKSLRSSSPRTRFYVSREDLDGGSIEFEEEDEVDVSSRSFEDREIARAVSAEDLLDEGDGEVGRVSRSRVMGGGFSRVGGGFSRVGGGFSRVNGGFSKSMDELDAVGGVSLRSRSYDPLDSGLRSDDSTTEKSPRLQHQSVSESSGRKSLERGRRGVAMGGKKVAMAKTLKKALPWIPRFWKLLLHGRVFSVQWSPNTNILCASPSCVG